MTAKRYISWLAVFLATVGLAIVQETWAAAPQSDSQAIRQVMLDQQRDWNRGDVVAFMRGYKDAADTTFVSSDVRKGYRKILASYSKHYTSPQQMGRLTFSALDIRLLRGAGGLVHYAAVTGRFHLDRLEHGKAGQDDGVFSLLWEKTPVGWKIILDHTS